MIKQDYKMTKKTDIGSCVVLGVGNLYLGSHEILTTWEWCGVSEMAYWKVWAYD